MSALGALCMTLLGRERDRLCHVLVNPPFDNSLLSPPFYFPDPAVDSYALADDGTHAPEEACIRLCEVPFVRTRYLFSSEQNRLPGTFSRLVVSANETVSRSVPVAISLDPPKCALILEERTVPLWRVARQR